MYLTKRHNIYYIFYKVNGKKTCKSTKATTKKEALEFLTTFKKEQKEKQLNPHLTLDEFYKLYMRKAEVFLVRTSWSLARRTFNQFLKAVGHTTKLNELTHNQCENYVFEKYKISKYSAALTLRHLKAAFNRAIQWELIEKNPFAKIKLPRIETKLPTFIVEEQLLKILEKENDLMLKVNYAFAFYTGLRLNESLNLKWKDVDLEKKLVFVRNTSHHITKSKKERIIPIGGKLEKYLNLLEVKGQDDFLFSKCGKRKFDGTRVSRAFKACIRLCNVDERLHYHSLRHSFASNLVSKGVSIYTVQKLMGHSSISVTSIYSHLNNQNLVDAIKVLD